MKKVSLNDHVHSGCYVCSEYEPYLIDNVRNTKRLKSGEIENEKRDSEEG
jgi:hypothetical protein